MREWSPILDTADLLGRARYVELACFSVLGRRALGAEDATIATFLAAAARAHGWRAVQLEELLPVSLGLPGVEVATRSPGAGIDGAIDALGAEPADAAVLDALAAVLYPALVGAYRARVATAHPAADRPLVRTLRRLTGDLEAVGEELAELCPEADGSSAPARALAEALSVAGGIFGSTI